MNSSPFQVGHCYTRQGVQDILQVPEERRGGNWDTGYTAFCSAYFVFCNVGTPGRTGHDYGDRWVGDELHWSAKRGSRLSHSSVQALVAGDQTVHVFWRDGDRKPFFYAGVGRATNVVDGSPVRLAWVFESPNESHPGRPAEELTVDTSLTEGAVKQVLVNAYERNPHARARCIDHHGLDCSVCGFNFERAYGEVGHRYIHVHHLNEISLMSGQQEVDPVRDLRPVCANCHSVLHRRRPAYSLEQVKRMLQDRATHP